MAIVISGNGIDMGNSPISNVDVGVSDNNAATVDYVKNNGDVSAITGFSQISGANEIVGVELTNNIHDVFGDGSIMATYQLNGNANDLGGNFNGTPTNVTYGDGKFGQAGNFNGSNGYVTLTGTAANIANIGLNDITISCWAKTNSIAPMSQIEARQTNGNGFGLTTYLTPGYPSFYVGDKQSTDYHVPNNTVSVDDNQWHHIVGVRRNTTTLELYIDNILVGTKIIPSVNITVDRNYIIGAGYGFELVGYYFNGSIDQVRIFNRALTQSEINILYTESKVPVNAQLNINQGTFIYPKGLGARGYIKSSDVFTGTVNVSAQTDGWKYVAKDENNNFSFYTDKPTIGKTSAELYLKDGKLYKQVDDTLITPISFLSNKIRIASGVAVELAPSDISKTVTETFEANYYGKNAVLAYALIDMTATPPTILDSYNISRVTRISNGVGKATLEVPTDKNNVTAICSSNAGGGSVTATTKSEISFATATTNQAKTVVIVLGGKN